jgi:uncharacterized membrane protein YedE/YeeE
MMRILSAGLAGLIFGLGLAIAEMINPAKILAFLDIAGNWDPSLALVLIAAAAVSFVGFHFTLKESKPILADRFDLPEKTRIDARLVIGAALFGIGWGVGGLCPGPGLASLAYGDLASLFFIGAMGLGLYTAGELS